MIRKVYSDTKTIEVGQNNVSTIEFFKHETGGIDIFKTRNADGTLIGIEGFFVGQYQIEYQDNTEQLDIFKLLEEAGNYHG